MKTFQAVVPATLNQAARLKFEAHAQAALEAERCRHFSSPRREKRLCDSRFVAWFRQCARDISGWCAISRLYHDWCMGWNLHT